MFSSSVIVVGGFQRVTVSIADKKGGAIPAMVMGEDSRIELARERHLLTTAEAADYLRLKRRTLEDMRVTGNGPRYYKLGPGRMSRVAYRKADLDAWVEKYAFSSTSEY